MKGCSLKASTGTQADSPSLFPGLQWFHEKPIGLAAMSSGCHGPLILMYSNNDDNLMSVQYSQPITNDCSSHRRRLSGLSLILKGLRLVGLFSDIINS